MEPNFKIDIPHCIHGISISYECVKCEIINTKLPILNSTLKEVNNIKLEIYEFMKEINKEIKCYNKQKNVLPTGKLNTYIKNNTVVKNIKEAIREHSKRIDRIEGCINDFKNGLNRIDIIVNDFFSKIGNLPALLEQSEQAKVRFEKALSDLKNVRNNHGEAINNINQKLCVIETNLKHVHELCTMGY